MQEVSLRAGPVTPDTPGTARGQPRCETPRRSQRAAGTRGGSGPARRPLATTSSNRLCGPQEAALSLGHGPRSALAPGQRGAQVPAEGPLGPPLPNSATPPAPVPGGRAACRAAAATHGHTRCPPGPRRRLACACSACATGRAGEAPGDPGEALRDKLRRLPTAGGGGPAGSWGAVGLHGCSAARGRQEETGWPGPLGTIARRRPCASPRDTDGAGAA